MKNKSITIYTVFIAAIFAIAVLFFSFAVILEYRNGSTRTGKIFDQIVVGTKSAVSKYQVESPEFRNTFEQLTGSFGNYDSLILSKNNLPVFVYPSGAIENSQSGRFYHAYSNTFSIGNDTYKISAVMYYLRPSSIFHYARFSFFIVLVGTLLTVVLLTYLYFYKNEAAEKSDGAAAASVNSKAFTEFNNFLDNNNPAVADTATDVAQEKTDTETLHEENFGDAETEYEKTSAEEKIDNNEVSTLHENNTANDAAPQGLFSPITGFGWEEYLEPRLNTELIRATASESDLSLLLVRVPGLYFEEPLAKLICTYLQQHFQYNDLLFEFGADGFAIIREGTSIDEALSIAEDVHAEITNIIEGKCYNCFVGLSTRSARILPGDRILFEASEALKHAIEEIDSPIIAFKANDEKYREYIETQII